MKRSAVDMLASTGRNLLRLQECFVRLPAAVGPAPVYARLLEDPVGRIEAAWTRASTDVEPLEETAPVQVPFFTDSGFPFATSRGATSEPARRRSGDAAYPTSHPSLGRGTWDAGDVNQTPSPVGLPVRDRALEPQKEPVAEPQERPSSEWELNARVQARESYSVIDPQPSAHSELLPAGERRTSIVPDTGAERDEGDASKRALRHDAPTRLSRSGSGLLSILRSQTIGEEGPRREPDRPAGDAAPIEPLAPTPGTLQDSRKPRRPSPADDVGATEREVGERDEVRRGARAEEVPRAGRDLGEARLENGDETHRHSSALDPDVLLDELEDRFERAMLRAYGTSGGQ